MIRWLSPAAVPFAYVQVCGGIAGNLLGAIEQYRLLKDWTEGGQPWPELHQANMSCGRLVSAPCRAATLKEIWRKSLNEV